jgi:LacI family transcriptional regulator
MHRKMVKRQITLLDIAKALSITTATVSRALNNHPAISDATKKRVNEVAKELGYEPNFLASGLRSGKTKTIGVIVPRINRHFFANVINGIEGVLNDAGYKLIICQSTETLKKEKQSLQTLLSGRVDGLIVSISLETKNAKHFDAFLGHKIPIVMFDRVLDDMKVSKVVNDDTAASAQVTRHLISQGFRKIMLLNSFTTTNVYRNRLHGYINALNEAGIEFNPELVKEIPVTMEDAYKSAASIFSGENIPDAVFATSDYIAMGVIKYLREKNIRIPQDVGIAGYANEPFTALIEPGLTTVEQYSIEMGKTAATLILDQLKNPISISINKEISIRPELIIRGSTQRL